MRDYDDVPSLICFIFFSQLMITIIYNWISNCCFGFSHCRWNCLHIFTAATGRLDLYQIFGISYSLSVVSLWAWVWLVLSTQPATYQVLMLTSNFILYWWILIISKWLEYIENICCSAIFQFWWIKVIWVLYQESSATQRSVIFTFSVALYVFCYFYCCVTNADVDYTGNDETWSLQAKYNKNWIVCVERKVSPQPPSLRPVLISKMPPLLISKVTPLLISKVTPLLISKVTPLLISMACNCSLIIGQVEMTW